MSSARLAWATWLASGRIGPRVRFPVITLIEPFEPPIMTTLLPMAAMWASLSGAAVLLMGSQLTPSSETQTSSAASGRGVLPGSVGPACWIDELDPAAGAPKATRLWPTRETPSRATVERSVGAVLSVQVWPSDELHDAASPGEASPRSLPTATILPPTPATPAARNPPSEVVACVQSRRVDECQAVECAAPGPIQRPMITNPPFHEPTTLGVYEPPAVAAPGSTCGDHTRPSVHSHATPLPAATAAPGRETTPAAIS